MGAQGKDGAEGVDGDGYGNAVASHSELMNIMEALLNLRTENQRLLDEINRVVDFVNKQDKKIETLANNVSDLWFYDEEHKERLDRLWDDCDYIMNWIRGMEAGHVDE